MKLSHCAMNCHHYESRGLTKCSACQLPVKTLKNTEMYSLLNIQRYCFTKENYPFEIH